MSDVTMELERLLREAPLPREWTLDDPFVESTTIGQLELSLLGLVAKNGDRDVAGSAAEPGAPPVTRAYFELFERCAVLEAMALPTQQFELFDEHGVRLAECARAQVFPEAPAGASFAYSKSNGVAAGPDWASACRSARAELLERHAVLSSWFGFSSPKRLEALGGPEVRALGGLYDVECYLFPDAAQTSVVGVFGFPRSSKHPTVYGLAGDADTPSATARAWRECMQRLAFLWGEQLPSDEPAFDTTANYHQEYVLWPGMQPRLRAWLEGEHLGRANAVLEVAGGTPGRAARLAPLGGAGFVDLTPPWQGAARLEKSQQARPRVAKAVATTELVLTFGRGHPRISSGDPALTVHPIA